ncbi:hypothetical protein FRC16_006286 [Serendipita sp. 398]|nr:hypothetical protein FRC16_006286 [Serendipita sp. 398]
MESSRKRPHETDGPVSIKKRAFASSNDTPVTSAPPGGEAEDPDLQELELFRKEAIYRRMLHYSREVERSQQLVEKLQSKTLSYEAALVAIETCWDQLLQQIQLLVKPGQFDDTDEESALFRLTDSSNPEGQIGKAYTEALRKKESRTVEILRSVVSASPSFPSPSLQDLQRTCQRLQSQVRVFFSTSDVILNASQTVSVRGELALMKTKLENATGTVEAYREQLSVAENRYERLKSQTVQKTEAKKSAGDETKDDGRSKQNGNHVIDVQTAPDQASIINGHVSSTEVTQWKERAEERLKVIEKLEDDLLQVNRLLQDARMELLAPSDRYLQSTHLFKVLQLTIDTHKKAEDALKSEVAALRDYITKMEAERSEYQTLVQNEANVKVIDLKSLLEKRENDLTRLRESRDALNAELHDRRTRDTDRDGLINQGKILANARGERITILLSEVQRLKTRLAARGGEESLFTFLLGKPQDDSYARALEERLDMLQRSKDALESTLQQISKENPDIASTILSEAEAREASMKLQARLDKLEAIYGAAALAGSTPEIQQLSEQLQLKEEELQKLRMELKASLEEPTTFYTEIERLSALWENLDKQLKNKIFDLSNMEEKLTKAAAEKSKADNKYFAAMREQDALKGVRNNQSREISKQGKVIDKLAEAEKSLTSQLTQLEKENQLQAKAISERDSMIALAQLQTEREHAILELSNKRAQELQDQLLDRDTQLSKHRSEINSLTEKCSELRREANTKVAKVRTAGTTHNEDNETTTERDNLLKILKCSTCKIEFRSKILVKCMHSELFCQSNCLIL